MLQKYEGRRLQLGMPEQFVLLLADIPDYLVLIEGHLTKAESTASLDKLKVSLNSLTNVCKAVLENQQFKQFLHFLLCAGNFLNYVSLSLIFCMHLYRSLKKIFRQSEDLYIKKAFSFQHIRFETCTYMYIVTFPSEWNNWISDLTGISRCGDCCSKMSFFQFCTGLCKIINPVRWHCSVFYEQGSLQGDAAGIKLSSFERLMEVKSGVPNLSLLHHLVKVANDKDDSMLKVITEMVQIDKISL